MQTLIAFSYPQPFRGKYKVFQPEVRFSTNDRYELYSVELNDDFTRVDIVCHANPAMESGGYVEIERNVFIRPEGYLQKYPLRRSKGVPASPQKHYFRHKNDSVRISLYFPPIGENTECIDLINHAVEEHCRFRFHGINLTKD